MDRENYEKARKDEKDSTIVAHQFTTDGMQHYAWGGDERTTTTGDDKKDEEETDKRKRAHLIWSPDGSHFVDVRKDNRHPNALWVINQLVQRGTVMVKRMTVR